MTEHEQADKLTEAMLKEGVAQAFLDVRFGKPLHVTEFHSKFIVSPNKRTCMDFASIFNGQL